LGLTPIGEETLDAFVGEGMLDHLLHHLVGNGSDVGAGKRGIHHVPGVANARGDDLGWQVVDLKDFGDLFDEGDPIPRNVVDTADEGAHIPRPGSRREQGLRG